MAVISNLGYNKPYNKAYNFKIPTPLKVGIFVFFLHRKFYENNFADEI